MNQQTRSIILYGSLIIIGAYFLVLALVKGQGFFVPLTIALLLSMLIVPVANKLEGWGLSRGWSAFLSDLVLIGFTVLIFWVIGMQVRNLKKDWPKLKKEMVKKAGELDETLNNYSWMGGSQLDLQKQLIKATSSGKQGSTISDPQSQADSSKPQDSQPEGSGIEQNNTEGSTGEQVSKKQPAYGQQDGKASQSSFKRIWGVVQYFFGFLGTMLLIFIYVFFFLLFRNKFQKSILHFVPEEKTKKANDIIEESAHIAQQYLFGKVILIIFLAVFYSIGLSIAGIDYAIFIAIISAVLSLLPYIGNIIGAGFAVMMALLSGSGSGASPLIGVLITFSIAQFIESYILEPFVVGNKVHVNPVMTIIIVVLGDFIWGIPGMVLAIPVLGILKVIWDRIPALEPLGYAVGDEGLDNSSSGINKFEKWVKKLFHKR